MQPPSGGFLLGDLPTSGGNQNFDRQLGEMAEQINAPRAGRDRHEAITRSMEATLLVIQVQLGWIEGELRGAAWGRGGRSHIAGTTPPAGVTQL